MSQLPELSGLDLSNLDLSGVIDKISKDPEMLNTARNILSSLRSGDREKTADGADKTKNEGGEEAGGVELASLLPALTQSMQGAKKERAQESNRDALLRALRPYLSEQRRNALDRMLSFERLGEILSSSEIRRILKQ